MATRNVSPTAVSAGDDEGVIAALVAIVNDLQSKLDTLTAKLDSDGGITDTDYASTVGSADTISYRGSNTPT